MARLRAAAPLIGLVTFFAAATVLARRFGYRVGGNVVVRCRDGHLFTTIWIPGASFKSLRLGTARFQRCPVGRHWTLVKPVRDSDLTDKDRERAASVHDVRIP